MSLDLYTAQVAAYSIFIGALVSTVLLIAVFFLYQGFRSAEKENQDQMAPLQKPQVQVTGLKERSFIREKKASDKKAA